MVVGAPWAGEWRRLRAWARIGEMRVRLRTVVFFFRASTIAYICSSLSPRPEIFSVVSEGSLLAM